MLSLCRSFHPLLNPRCVRASLRRGLAAKASPVDLSVAECKTLISEADHAYLDVRTAEEFEQHHANESVNVPFLQVGPQGMEENAGFLKNVEEKFSKDTPLVVGCKMGGRSAMAVRALHAAGYTSLVNMVGGFDAWKEAA